MNSVDIFDLPIAGDLSDDDIVLVGQNGITKRATALQLRFSLSPIVPAWPLIPETEYFVNSGHNGYRLPFTANDPVEVTLSRYSTTGFSTILTQLGGLSGQPLVHVIPEGTANIICGDDDEDNEHRYIAGLGYSLFVWCYANEDGESAQYLIEGVTAPTP